MANKNCTFNDPSKVVVSIDGTDFDGKQIAETIKIQELESIEAVPTMSGTTYNAKNAVDYTVTLSAVKGSELNNVLEDAFQSRSCMNVGLFDYNASSNLSIISDSVVILKRGEISVGSSESRVYFLHASWVNI